MVERYLGSEEVIYKLEAWESERFLQKTLAANPLPCPAENATPIQITCLAGDIERIEEVFTRIGLTITPIRTG